MNGELTTAILRDIREGVRDTNARLDQTNARLDQTNARMEEGFDLLSRRIVESELRTATAITELAASVRDVAELLRSQHDLRPRVERCEAHIAALKKQGATGRRVRR